MSRNMPASRSCSTAQRNRSADNPEDGAAGLVALPYPCLDPASFDISIQHATHKDAGHQEFAHAAAALEQHQVAQDELLSCIDDVPTDAEASIMLLCSQLYPNPATAAAAAAAAKQSRSAKRSKNTPGPSKATAAAIAAAAAAAVAAKELPHIILKSQLYTVLADRTAVDRELEDLKERGKAKLFKLSIGADEYVVMLAADYFNMVDGLIAKHLELSQQLQAQEQQQQQAAHAAASTVAADNIVSSSAEHAALAATLQLFRSRVAPVYKASHITCTQLVRLMRTAPAGAAASGGGAANRPAAAAAAATDAEAIQRHLLSAELICRDSRVQDSYMLTIPGAAAFVKSVVAGRQELLQTLQRKKYQEVLEKEFICFKLRSSCLTPSFHLKDLQGRGLVSCIETTAGKLIRLVKRK